MITGNVNFDKTFHRYISNWTTSCGVPQPGENNNRKIDFHQCHYSGIDYYIILIYQTTKNDHL